ncbi:MAG TPA: TIGR03621 family F420-dependent LLM class oxidoreductase [Dehalococcoidia bacterium]|nr:TIGR03621 family F420-dependent LLM class oxidoreductase [Dehalococcoidia bacterium]
MNQRKFRFGITGRGQTAQEWRDFARKAEDLGYSTLILPDHLIETMMAPLLVLTAAAQVTSRLRFGTLVLANDLRHPAVLAKEAATLDVLTEGRFELGIGTGSQDADNHKAGIKVDEPGVRVERMRETLQILKAAFTQDSVDYRGKHYQITGLPGYPKPVQQPHMPILLGAGGPRMLRMAAREADIIGLIGTAETLGEKLTVVRKAAGERYDAIEFNQLHMRLKIEGHDAFGPQMAGAPALEGSVDQIAEKLLETRERFDVSYPIIIGTAITAFAPVVAKLNGS